VINTKVFFVGFIATIFVGIIWTVLNHSGGFHESCNRDGGCDDGLACNTNIGWCEMKDNPPTYARDVSHPVRDISHEYHGIYESEKFCINCKNLCKDTGMAECNFSDTSVWGNTAPATCKCK